MDLGHAAETLRAALDAKQEAREKALPLCRSAIRFSANSIRATHRQDRKEAERLMDEARSALEQASAATEGHPDIRHAGFIHDAAKEYAEARFTFAMAFREQLPEPQEVGVEPAAYLNGLAEAVGEMRRHALDLMRQGHLDRSEEILGAMDEIYYVLTSMDYPDAMTGGLRRTTDIARSIIERTRGDLSTTLIQQNLMKALEARGS